MLYKLLYGMSDVISPLNVFRYITFRTALAVLTAAVITLVLTPWLIKKLSVTQQIRLRFFLVPGDIEGDDYRGLGFIDEARAIIHGAPG